MLLLYVVSALFTLLMYGILCCWKTPLLRIGTKRASSFQRGSLLLTSSMELNPRRHITLMDLLGTPPMLNVLQITPSWKLRCSGSRMQKVPLLVLLLKLLEERRGNVLPSTFIRVLSLNKPTPTGECYTCRLYKDVKNPIEQDLTLFSRVESF
ncbi:hypothetical protein [wheat yellow stunt associated betaflexivirus]|nr:hypothetical protein [wheat yellow stunt associated betaflexivirus]